MAKHNPDARTALYRLLAANGRLLYIGIAANPDARWGGHSNKQPWWDNVADRKVEWFPSRAAAAAAEVKAIKEERPLHNKQHAVSVASTVRQPRSSLKCDDAMDVPAEHQTLGGMLRWPDIIPEVTTLLGDGSCFQDAVSRVLYQAIVTAHEVQSITIDDVAAELETNDTWNWRAGVAKALVADYESKALTRSATVHCAVIVRTLKEVTLCVTGLKRVLTSD